MHTRGPNGHTQSKTRPSAIPITVVGSFQGSNSEHNTAAQMDCTKTNRRSQLGQRWKLKERRCARIHLLARCYCFSREPFALTPPFFFFFLPRCTRSMDRCALRGSLTAAHAGRTTRCPLWVRKAAFPGSTPCMRGPGAAVPGCAASCTDRPNDRAGSQRAVGQRYHGNELVILTSPAEAASALLVGGASL